MSEADPKPVVTVQVYEAEESGYWARIEADSFKESGVGFTQDETLREIFEENVMDVIDLMRDDPRTEE